MAAKAATAASWRVQGHPKGRVGALHPPIEFDIGCIQVRQRGELDEEVGNVLIL
jgi:hypothetical protein